MKTVYTLVLATLGLLATGAYAAPLHGAVLRAVPSPSESTDGSAGTNPYTGVVILYDTEGNVCPNDPANQLPIVALNENQFGDFTESPTPAMCNKCVSIKGNVATILARIVGVCEGCGDQYLEMKPDQISKLNGDDNNQFTNEDVTWEIVDCNQT